MFVGVSGARAPPLPVIFYPSVNFFIACHGCGRCVSRLWKMRVTAVEDARYGYGRCVSRPWRANSNA